VDLDAAADELYRVPPGEFTARRDALAASARAAGEPDLAAAIKRFRKPSASAWLTNLLVREEREAVHGFLDLGPALREAQKGLAGDDLRELSQQRRQAVDALVRQAGTLAKAEGHPASTTVLAEVQATLEAGLSNPDAADEIRQGRLRSALHYAGLGTEDVAATPPARRSERDRGAGEIEEARRELDAAKWALAEQEDAVEQAGGRLAELRARITDLQTQLDDLKGDEAHASQRLRAAERERAAAARRVREAEQQLKRLRSRR
jgi:hypothetical protein